MIDYCDTLSLESSPVVPKVQTFVKPCGNDAWTFSEQVQDTIRAHGIADAAKIYARKGVKVQEFLIFARPALVKR